MAIGLSTSGMTNPDKVIGFLDITGDWDYSLALVMGGAVTFNLIFYTWAKKRERPFLSKHFSWPTKTLIDKKLLIGSSLFGIGWGLSGICPGPALVNLVLFDLKVLLFVGCLLLGIIFFRKTEKYWS